MTNKEIIAVVSAFEAGEKIEATKRGQNEWTWVPRPAWNFDFCDYRVAVELVECWVNLYANGCTFYYNNEDQAKKLADESAIRVAVHLKEVV
jgi:hypothetical protein